MRRNGCRNERTEKTSVWKSVKDSCELIPIRLA